ncbi:MAG: thermosome subunit [DPANN group archaeon]|nr:thermosome subunit [DPANN group archaeon]
MTNQQVQPIFILPEGTQRTTGRNAQKNNIAAAKLVAETVRTTLGPKGMDKMLVDSLGDVVVTNDGVTILKEMAIEHPAAKMIVEVAKTQENEVGDGTTTAVVIAGELLKKAETLLDKQIHPTVIAKGFRMAENKAQEILQQIGEPVSESDTKILNKLAMTAMTGKGAESAKGNLAQLAVEAIRAVTQRYEDRIHIDIDDIKVEKKVGASVDESVLVKGILVDKEKVHPGMPRKIEKAKIALVDSAFEIKNPEVDAKIQITDPNQLQAFLEQEEQMLRRMVDSIANAGATVIFCQKGIDDIAQHFMAKKNIFAARRVKKSDIEKLSKATGARIITNLDDITKNDLGFAGRVEERKVGDENMIYVEDCKNPKAVTLLIRGGTEHVVDEVKRAMDDALGDIASALKTGKVVAGAGSIEMEVARGLRKFANSLSGREQLAVQLFAESLEIIPVTLAENAGLDPIDILTTLKAAHDKKNKWIGVDVFSGKAMDAWAKGVIEPLAIKTQAISSASEVAVMILRIDDVIASSGGGKNPMPPDMGGMGGMQGMGM